jgi:hypothetical protein
MTQSSSSTTLRPSELTASLDLIEVKPGVKFSKALLTGLLPTVEDCLFFAKLYELDPDQLGNLLYQVLGTDLAAALFGQSGLHSHELQDYLLGYEDEWGTWHDGIIEPAHRGDVTFDPDVPHGEILPEVWKDLEVEVAQAIKDVAAKLESVVGMMPGKQGKMVFQAMRTMNAKRPVLGDFKARIHHDPMKQNLVILDVSGSMTEQTIRTIIEDVVALSYTANAHLAIVSSSCFYWEPGTYNVEDVLAKAEFGGTHYETLKSLFDRDWGVVVTIADYDSSLSAKRALSHCTGHIDQVMDISLVNRATFLAECVGQMAAEVKPLLVGRTQYVVGSHYDEMYSDHDWS